MRTFLFRARRQVLYIFSVALLVVTVLEPANAAISATTSAATDAVTDDLPQSPQPLPLSLQKTIPRFDPGPCNFDVQTSLNESSGLQCGTLTVPERYENPNGPTIQLGVAIIKSHASNPAPDPVVMLQGGPGGSTIDTYLQIIPFDPRLRNINRDIVLFDQRGTEFAKPSLFCQQYYNESIRQLNEDLSTADSNQRAQAALKACHDQWVSQGIDLSAYNSLENAADVNSLREALGYAKINLYGVSYGTLLALHVLRQYPQGLRSVIIDSVVPPQKNFIPDAPQSENRALDAVFTSCAQQPDCNAAYPNLKNVFYNEVNQLNANKKHITLVEPKTRQEYPALLDGDTLISAVIQMLYLTDFIPLIPRVIYNVRASDYSFIEQVLSLVVFDRSVNLGMYYSVLCAEDADFKPQDVNLNGLPKELANEEKDSGTQFLQTCSFWNVAPLPPTVDQPVSSTIPTLVLSGAFDPITPPSYAQTAAQTLSQSYFFLIPVGGHGEVTSGACQDSIFLQFLDNPNKKPDGTCAAQQKIVFSTPGALVQIPSLISLLNLQGASAVEFGVLALALLFLLTALLLYPLVWLVRVFRRSARPVPAPDYPSVGEAGSAVASPSTRSSGRSRGIYRLAPWLAGFAGLLLLVFIVAVAAITLQLGLANDSRLLIGLPGSTRPLFILPWAALALSVFMFFAAIVAWARQAGSAWGRLYFSLLTISTWVCLAILGIWGMLTALLKG